MRFNSLEAWLQWQVGLHHREIELGLDRVSKVWQRLWDKPLPFTVVTVAGTNGKGSSVAFLDQILRSANYRVGSFTSPHLVRYNERIRINGKMATDDTICRAFDEVDQARDETPLTYFEFSALTALWIFSHSDLDAAILEVGLGGRLDAVNIVDPDVSLITTIALDHTHWLGNSLDQIAREKSGIMRAGRPTVCAMLHPPDALLAHASSLGTSLYLAGREFSHSKGEESWEWRGNNVLLDSLPMPVMPGDYQLQNAAGVLMVLQLLGDTLPVEEASIREGLGSAVIAGRFQVLPGKADTILDVAHNPDAARVLADNLSRLQSDGRTLAVFSMMGDKDTGAVVEALVPMIDEWHLPQLELPRALAPRAIREALTAAGVDRHSIVLCSSPLEAYQSARSLAAEGDRVLVFGSFYLVGAVVGSVLGAELV